MSNQEQDKEYRGILNTILICGFAMLVFHLYVFCYSFFTDLGIPLGILTNFIRALNEVTHLFNNTWASKLAALFFLLIYCVGNKTKKDISATWNEVYYLAMVGLIIYFGNFIFLSLRGVSYEVINLVYGLTTFGGYLLLIKAGAKADSIMNITMENDPFNDDNESFQQETELMNNEYSVNIPTKFTFKGKLQKGWVNIVNPFRAMMVLGTPGSGKSFAVINNYIRQHIEKGFTMFIYDYKFPDLSAIAYHYLKKNTKAYTSRGLKVPKFYTINFDDARRSHRCNPLLPSMLTDIIDAQESAKTILLNMNRTWIKKQGEFFVESPVNFLTACIWYLKLFNDRKVAERRSQLTAEEAAKPGAFDDINYCTFPHVIEFANHAYDEIFPILLAEPSLEKYTNIFASAFHNGALEQLEGQIASLRIPLARLSSPVLAWVMTGNDFTLDLNNPEDPKILCVGNNPVRQQVYGTALGLYNARMVKLVNTKKRRPCSLIIDELPTIYFSGIDNLIATARSNKVSTCLGIQDLTQLKRDYGQDEASVIFNTIGNIASGQVVGETAKNLSSRFGKNVQQRQSFNVSEKETTTNLSTQMDSLIPESKISGLSQGRFVGSVADNFGETIKQKIFHAELVVDPAMIKELENLEPIPPISIYADLSEEEMNQLLVENELQMAADVRFLIKESLDTIRNSPELNYLLANFDTKDPDYLLNRSSPIAATDNATGNVEELLDSDDLNDQNQRNKSQEQEGQDDVNGLFDYEDN